MKKSAYILIILTIAASLNTLAQDNLIINNNLTENQCIESPKSSTQYIKTSTYFFSKKESSQNTIQLTRASNRESFTYDLNNNQIIDSVYHYSYGQDTVISKEIWSNCYETPIMISSYVQDNAEWIPIGKIEFMYKEEGYDIIEVHYTYNNGFKLNKKIYINTDDQDNIVFRAEKKWKNITLNWNNELLSNNNQLNEILITDNTTKTASH